jgi:phage major head subunit gpT-like protein
MSVITEREYERLRSNLWWNRITKTRPTTGLKDVITWLLSTAQIRDQQSGGNIRFDDLVAQYTTIENKFSGAGLKLSRAQLEDTDGGGMELSAQWSADIGAYMSYWPQEQVSHLLLNAHTPGMYMAYDGKPFFAADHPYNPFKESAGVFGNILTGAAVPATGYPGACPIDDSINIEEALKNLGKIVAYIATLKMPNGRTPRFLRPSTLLVPPRMFPRAVQLTSAKFLAQAATSGGGSADVEGLIKALGFAMPMQADELAGFENDTTFFIGCEQMSTSQLGGVLYTEREAFRINYYGTVDDAVLGRAQELEWQCHGRNVVSAGHPYLLIKCKAS